MNLINSQFPITNGMHVKRIGAYQAQHPGWQLHVSEGRHNHSAFIIDSIIQDDDGSAAISLEGLPGFLDAEGFRFAEPVEIFEHYGWLNGNVPDAAIVERLRSRSLGHCVVRASGFLMRSWLASFPEENDMHHAEVHVVSGVTDRNALYLDGISTNAFDPRLFRLASLEEIFEAFGAEGAVPAVMHIRQPRSLPLRGAQAEVISADEAVEPENTFVETGMIIVVMRQVITGQMARHSYHNFQDIPTAQEVIGEWRRALNPETTYRVCRELVDTVTGDVVLINTGDGDA